jgi:DNA helicase-2/ATP-dependent DNA helicase PcrA
MTQEGSGQDLSQEKLDIIAAPRGTARKVVAGAGTGKTKTMVERFAHLVDPAQGLDPLRILVVTFTKKAAGELADRISNALLTRGLVHDRADLDAAWIGTFHGLCIRLLREDCYEIGFDRDLKVIDPLEERLLVQEVQRDLRDGLIEGAGILELEATDVDDAARLSYATFAIIRTMKGQGVLPDDLLVSSKAAADEFWGKFRTEQGPDYAYTDDELADEEARELVCATYREYERRLVERGLIDFDGILVRTRDALQDNPEWAAMRREFFQHIIVDEFQDTNRVQVEMLELLAQPNFGNVEVVGDPKQSIYGWRDADIRNILRFEGERHQLTINYRSPQPVLDAALHVIRQDPQFADEPALVADNGPGDAESVCLYRADTPEDEAKFVASKILEVHQAGKQWSDIAILTRMRRPPIAFEQELRRAGIPYVTGAGYGFFEREEIKDVLAYLRVTDNPLDDAAVVRLLQGPLVRVTDGELFRLLHDREHGQHSWDALRERLDGEPDAVDTGTARRIREVLQLVAAGSARRAGTSLSQLLQWILDMSGYPALAAADPSASARRLGNLRKLQRMAADYESRAVFSGLRDFIEYVELHGEHEVEVGEADVEGADAVSFMTIHGAKGLEFPVVFLAHLKPFRNTGERWSLRYDDGLGLVVKKADGKDTPKFNAMKQLRVGDMPLDLEREEMRRLVYVAVTRAREQVFITATPRDDPDWDSVLVDNVGGKARPAPNDDYFRSLALWASSGAGTLLEPEVTELSPWTGAADAQATTSYEQEPTPVDDGSPEPADRAPARMELSFSAMELFAQCPLRYRYASEWRLPVPPDDLWPADAEPSSRAVNAATLGTLVHATLEAFHHPGPLDGTGGLSRLRDLWNDATNEVLSPEVAGDVWERQAEAMFARYLELDVAGFRTRATEQEVNLVESIDGREVVIRGFIDRLCDDPAGTAVIVDYKTNRQIGAEAAAAYARQLSIYERAAGSALGIAAEPILIELRKGTIRKPDAESGWAGVEDLLRTVLSETRPAPPDAPCGACGYRRSCPASTAVRSDRLGSGPRA